MNDFYQTEIADNVRIVFENGDEFRGIVGQAADNVIWIVGGDLYWRDNGENVAGRNGTKKMASRIEHASLDELEPLLDISVLE